MGLLMPARLHGRGQTRVNVTTPLAGGADAVHLEDGLGGVQADGGDRAHGLLLCRWLLEAAMLPHRWVGAVHSIMMRHSRFVGGISPKAVRGTLESIGGRDQPFDG